MTDVPVSIVITAQERAAASLERVEKSVNRLDRAFGTLAGRLKAGLQWHLTYQAIRAVENAIRGLINVIPNLISRGEAWASTVDDIADATGMAAEQASTLAGVQALLGGSTAKLGASMAIFAKNVETSPKIMKELGAQIVRTKDGSVDAYSTFQNLRNAIAATGSSTRSTRFAMQLLGRGARDLLDLLLLSPRAFRSYAAEARRMGLILSEAGLAAAEQWKRTKSMLDLAVTGIGAQVLQAAAPALTALVNGITKVLEQNMENIARFAAQAVGFIAGLISGLLGIPIQLDLVTASVKDAGAGTGRVWDGIKKQEQAAGDAANRSTKAIQGQVDAIDRKLGAIDRAEDRRQARQEYRELQRDLAEARRDLRNVRDQSVLAATMSNAEAELARQAKARDVKEATSKVRTAEEALSKWRHDQRIKDRRQALEDRRAAIQGQVGAMRAGAARIASGVGDVMVRSGKSITGVTTRLAKDMADRMQTAMKDAQRFGLEIADSLKDIIFGEDKLRLAGGVAFEVRSGGLIGALQSVQGHLQNLGKLLDGQSPLVIGLGLVAARLLMSVVGGAAGGLGSLLSGAAGAAAGAFAPLAAAATVAAATIGSVLAWPAAQLGLLGDAGPRREGLNSDRPISPNTARAMERQKGRFTMGAYPRGGSVPPESAGPQAGFAPPPLDTGPPKRTSLTGDMGAETQPISIAAWQRIRSRNPFNIDGSAIPARGVREYNVPDPKDLGFGGGTGSPWDFSRVGGGSAASASKTLQSLLPFGRRFFDFGSPVGSLLNDNLGATTQAGQATQQTAANTKNLPTGVPIRGIVPVKGSGTNGRMPITGTVGAVGPRGGAVPTAGTARVTNPFVPVKGGVRVENRPEVKGTVGITSPGGGVAATIATVRNRVGITGDVGIRGKAKVQGAVEATNAAFARIGKVIGWEAPPLPVRGTIGVTGAKGGGVPITGSVQATNSAFRSIGTINRWAAPSLPVRGVVGVTGAKGGSVPTAGTAKVTNTVPVTGNVAIPKGVPVRGRVAVAGNVGVPAGVKVKGGAVEATNEAFGRIGKVTEWNAPALPVTGKDGGPLRTNAWVVNRLGVTVNKAPPVRGAVEATNKKFEEIGQVSRWTAPALPVRGNVGVSAPGGGAVNVTGGTKITNPAVPVTGGVKIEGKASVGGSVQATVKGAVAASNPAFGLIGKLTGISTTQKLGVAVKTAPPVKGSVQATNAAFGNIGKVTSITASQKLGVNVAEAPPVTGDVGLTGPVGLDLVTIALLSAIAGNVGATREWTDLMKPVTTPTGLLVRGGVRVVALDRVIGLLGRVADGIERFIPYFGTKGLLVETGTVPVTLPGTQPVDVKNEKVTVGVPSLPNVTIGDVAKRLPTIIEAIGTPSGNLPVGVQNRVGTKIEATEGNLPVGIQNDRVPVGVQNRAGVKIEATDINVPVGVKNDRLAVGVQNKPDVELKKGDLWPTAVLVQLVAASGTLKAILKEGIKSPFATFAEGTPFVQSTGPAVIHRGEMIVPRRLSDAIRSNAATLSASGATPSGGGGGGSRIDLTLVLDGRVLARALGLFVGPGTTTVRANLST